MATQSLRSGTGFRNPTRIQESVFAAIEKRLLIWLAERVPVRINSDHLTVLGFAAQLLTGFSYALARLDNLWLLAAIGFIALNWFGDSLDGTLARVRNRLRPRYGFYVDHVTDAIGTFFLMGGLAVSGIMTPYIGLGLLIAFLLLSIEVYLATYTIGKFHLSFWSFGPTELRLLLCVGNLAVFLRGPGAKLFGRDFLLFDIGGICGMVGMGAMLIWTSIRHTRQLYQDERLP
jgi:phosphatidylglycerophosphate synthase